MDLFSYCYIIVQLRPPQPAVYLFILDVSHNAVETGYLNVFCQSLLDNINAYVQHSQLSVAASNSMTEQLVFVLGLWKLLIPLIEDKL